MSQSELDTRKVSFVTVTDDNAGQRLDNFLLSLLKGVPKALIYRVIRKGEVRINKKRAKADTRVAVDDLVRIPPMRVAERDAPPPVSAVLSELLKNAIVHEDDGLLVVNKPSGLAVHGGSGVNLGLIEALRQMRPQHTFLELVHRLDRDTSGLILVAKKRSVLTALQRMLANKAGIAKRYLALVHGGWDRKIKDVKVPLLRIERKSGERMVIVDDEGKKAHTRTRLLNHGPHYALIEAEPVTGRTHQIRVHCQYEGHVIAGDQKYRDKVAVDIDKKQGINRLLLHAWQLEFRHPSSGDFLKLEAWPDDEFQQILAKAQCELTKQD